MPFGWAAAGAAVAGVAGSVIQGEATKSAAKQASKTQQAAQDAAEARFQQTRSDLMPYMEAGTNALGPQQDLLGLNGQEAADKAMGNFQASPGYQYQLEQGIRAIDNSASANGMLNSGSRMKALQDRGNSLAAIDFGTYYNRLAGLTGLGQNAAAGVGNTGTQVSQMGTQTAAGQAQTQTSAATAQNSIYGNAIQGVGNAANNYANNQLYSQQTNALMQPGMSYGSFNVGAGGGGTGMTYEQLAGWG